MMKDGDPKQRRLLRVLAVPLDLAIRQKENPFLQAVALHGDLPPCKTPCSFWSAGSWLTVSRMLLRVQGSLFNC